MIKRPVFTVSSLWLALVLVSTAWLAMVSARHIARIEQVSGQAPTLAEDAASPTGYARGTRGLLLPVGAASGQAWLMETQTMIAQGAWRIDHVDYDNAPEGRPAHGPLPYRWWLRIVAGSEALVAGVPGGRAVERAALHADPALVMTLCLAAGLLAAWRFGAVAGGFLALGIAALFAHTQIFSPGRPDGHGLFLVANLAAVLALLAGWQTTSPARGRGWFGAAGAAHGLALWLDPGSQLAVLGTVLVGGLAATWAQRRWPREAPAVPWLTWALSLAAVTLIGWLAEGRPGGLAGRSLDTVHPLLALTGLGVGGILTWAQRHPAPASRLTRWLGFAAGSVLLAAPVAWLIYRTGPGGVDFGPHHPVLSGRGGLFGWLKQDGLSLGAVAVLLPLLLVPVSLRLVRERPELRTSLAFCLGALAVMLALGSWQLSWWGLVDVMLLGLLVLAAAASPGDLPGIAWRSALGLLLLPALIAAWPRATPDRDLEPAEARALVERDVAQWLAARSEPGTIAFAPPALSGSLAYYGGLRVIASPFPGNQDGLTLSARIAGTGSTDEAQALVQQRGVRYIVLPSWDETLDRLARAGSPTPERSLVSLLRQWLPPRWLRPVAYQLPVIPGMERQSLDVFEVVEPQENSVALSRLAEYFVDTSRLDLAAALADSLEQTFAADAGAMIARARVALARKESRTLARIMPELLPAIADGRDEDLPWERRASLAIVLAQTKHPDLARTQIEFCLQEADAERLASLGPVGLFRLLALSRAFRIDFSDPELRAAAMNLLPAEFQAQLPP